MRNSNNAHSRGVSLVAAVAIMLIAGVLGAGLVSMLGVASRVSVDYARSARAWAITQGGRNWYLQQLAGTGNWLTALNQTAVPLGQGTFDVNVTVGALDRPQPDSLTATALNLSVAGYLGGTDNTTIKRAMSERIWKLPSASKFALFWGRRTGSALTLTNVRINGDFWSQGRAGIPSSSTVVNGTAFRPATEDITGAGSYSEGNITFPYFSSFAGASATYSTPPFNTAYYTGLISGYNGRLNACTSAATINQNSDLVLAGNTVCCRNFNTNTNTTGTNVTIRGNGFIVANRDITLNTSGSNGRRLTISPSGGNIVFLANRSLTVNAGTGGTHPVTAAGSPGAGVRMYARSATSTSQLLDINNANTLIDRALILALRRLRVQNGADITNSTLFVNDAGSSAANNVLIITGTGTVVGTTDGPSSVISVSDANPALQVATRASVAGLLYQKHANPASGYTAIAGSSSANRVTITGTAIVNQCSGNAVRNANMNYDPAAIPDPPPEGFDGFAAKKPDTWQGN